MLCLTKGSCRIVQKQPRGDTGEAQVSADRFEDHERSLYGDEWLRRFGRAIHPTPTELLKLGEALAAALEKREVGSGGCKCDACAALAAWRKAVGEQGSSK